MLETSSQELLFTLDMVYLLIKSLGSLVFTAERRVGNLA